LSAVQEQGFIWRLAYALRDRLNAELFRVLEPQAGDVLDVGGGSFYQRLRTRGHSWRTYTVLEPTLELLPLRDDGVLCAGGSAGCLPFANESFDLVLAVQVLEHVFDAHSATREMFRVLRPGGRMVILVPQSGTLHLVPHHYANLTRFWLFEQAKRLEADVVSWTPIGGAWRTIASRLGLMFLPVFNLKGTQDPALRQRSIGLWLILPIQMLVAAIILPAAMLLSLFDIQEEANNHLIVLQKPFGGLRKPETPT
jgi:SAM-dependent methyltransferase